uniref:Uncharacterized protein n=1 Tax=Cacopsylla melanoneura TaxID=428564 RepID=A0A8D8W881_9HEMI
MDKSVRPQRLRILMLLNLKRSNSLLTTLNVPAMSAIVPEYATEAILEILKIVTLRTITVPPCGVQPGTLSSIMVMMMMKTAQTPKQVNWAHTIAMTWTKKQWPSCRYSDQSCTRRYR